MAKVTVGENVVSSNPVVVTVADYVENVTVSLDGDNDSFGVVINFSEELAEVEYNVFLDDELLEPKQNPGFEFGHMVIDKNGRKCNCGKNGCFETYASMKRFKAEAISIFNMSENTEAEEVQKYIRENINKKNVKEFVDEYLTNVSIGLANIVNIFEPQAISFGGSFSYYCDIFLPILNEKIDKLKFNKETKVDLITAKLKNDAGIIGATEI